MAYKVFTNGSPLPASDLNTYLMNQSVMVFANSTARSAALTSPTEGMVTYLEDTNAIEVYTGSGWVGVGGSPITTQGDLIIGNSSNLPARLAIGSNGTVLTSNGTTATWAAAAAPTETWTELIAPTNFPAGVATVTLSSFAARNQYMLLVGDMSATSATGGLRIRFNADSGSNYTIFRNQINAASSYAAGNFSAVYEDTTSLFAFGGSSNAAYSGSASVLIMGTQGSGRKPFEFTGGANDGGGNNQQLRWGSGYWENSAALTSIELATVNGNFDGGNYTLLGAN